MVITQTPFRMSFLGGGTDYRTYFEEYGGSVLSTTFDKYCYVTARKFPPFFEYHSKFVYSKIETFNLPEELEHPVLRACLMDINIKDINIVYDADLPARSGLGSSSSFAVGLYHALHALRAEYVDKMTLAKEAIRLEQELLGEAVGVQDQLAAAFGGLNRMILTSDGYDVQPVIMHSDRKQLFNSHLMLFFTGFVRYADEIAQEQVRVTKNKLTELHEMKSLVEEGIKILTSNSDLSDFGLILDHSWQLKRSLTIKITTDAINDMYEGAKKAGALGGKLLGAGGGGFLLLFVEPKNQKQVKDALNGLLQIPFKFENYGSRVIYYREDE